MNLREVCRAAEEASLMVTWERIREGDGFDGLWTCCGLDAPRVPGHDSRSVYRCLAGLAMVLRPASVVEIGTGFGHGAVVLAWAAKAWGGKVVTVDIDRYRDAEIDVTGQATEAVALIRRVYDNVRLVVADTQSANDKTPILLETLASAKPDFAFIDGEHKGNAAYIDLASVWPLMPSGAVAVLDDAHSSVFDKAHARHPWCDDVFASATRFVRERRDEVADVCLWAYPRAGLRGPEDERPWVLIRKA